MPLEDSLDGPDYFMYWVEENRLSIQWENEEIKISWKNMFYILNIYIKMIKIMFLPRQKIPKDVESNDLIMLIINNTSNKFKSICDRQIGLIKFEG